MLTEVFIPVHKAGLQQIFRNYDAYNIFCSFFTERLYLESSVAWGIFKTWAISRCFILQLHTKARSAVPFHLTGLTPVKERSSLLSVLTVAVAHRYHRSPRLLKFPAAFLPQTHIAKPPCNGKYPRQRLSIGNIVPCMFPHCQKCFLHHIF